MVNFLEKNMKAGVLLLFFGLFCYGSYKFYLSLFPTAELNYRLDVTFEVDGVPVIGSAVQKLNVKRVRGLTPRAFKLTATGEAVSIDLPNRKAVFVLLASPRKDGVFTGGTNGGYNFLLPEACNLWIKRDQLGPSGFVRFFQNFSGSCSVPLEDLPLMVTFQDEADPSTVMRVFPNDPGSVLGKGVQFRSAIVTITDNPITTGIGRRLKWLSDYPSRLLEIGPPSQSPPLPQVLQHGYFRRLERG